MSITQQLTATIGGLRGPSGADGADGADGANGTMSPADVLATIVRSGVFATPDARSGGQAGGGAGYLPDLSTGTVSRSTTAWALGTSRLAPAAVDQARISDKGLYAGDAVTALNADFDTINNWTTNSATKSVEGGTGPNAASYVKVTPSSATGYVTKTFTSSLSTRSTVAVVIKRGTSNKTRLQIAYGGAAFAYIEFGWKSDGTPGAIIEFNIDRFFVHDFGGGEFLVGFTYTSHSSTTSGQVLVMADRNGASGTVYLCHGAAYESTLPAPPPRNAADAQDTFTRPVSLGATFTMGIDFEVPHRAPASSERNLLTLDDGDADEDNAIRLVYNTDGTIGLRITVGASAIVTAATSVAALRGTDMRVAVLIGSGRYVFQVGDNTVASGTLLAALFKPARLCIGHSGVSGKRAMAPVSSVFLANGNHLAARAASAPEMNVLRLHGQSNASGLGIYATDNGDAIVGSAYEYLTLRQRFGFLYSAPSAYTSGDFTTGASFQRIYAGSDASSVTMSDQGLRMGPEAGIMYGRRNTVLVKYAVTGSQLATLGGTDDWNPANAGELYDKANQIYAAAIANLRAAGYKPSACRAIHWIQGEADGNGTTNANNYQANLTALIAAWRTYHANAALPFVIYRLNPFQTAVANLSTIRTAQAAVDAADLYAVMVDTDAVTNQKGDNLHYTAQGAARIGLLGAAAEATLVIF